MAEPQPPLSSTELATATEDAEVPAPAPAGAEDRKAAAALSSLDAPADDAAAPAKSQADTKALGEAMSRLELLDKAKGKGSGSASAKTEKEKKEEEVKKVKVDAGDVAMLVSRANWRTTAGLMSTLQVEHLELNRAKATELLKNHEGSAEKALTAYITAHA
jgi:hypothetical protein